MASHKICRSNHIFHRQQPWGIAYHLNGNVAPFLLFQGNMLPYCLMDSGKIPPGFLNPKCNPVLFPDSY